ncbi:unnamed protein product [Leuciscus chuanchicus]
MGALPAQVCHGAGAAQDKTQLCQAECPNSSPKATQTASVQMLLHPRASRPEAPENYKKKVDNTTTISFYTEDWAQVNSMGLLCRLTNREDHTAHLWDSGRPLHPIVNMTNEKKYPIKQAFVCARLQENGICLALSSQ